MKERKGIVKSKGKELTLLGNGLKVGDSAPNFIVTENDMSEFNFQEHKNKIFIISAVPSLDTAVCDRETRTFNEKASELSNEIEILTISTDLPFAQKRWCGSAGIDKVKTLSDHKDTNFGIAYGVLIKELRLLARAVFVVDKNRKIQYIELLSELGNEPNYSKIIEKAKELI